MNSRTDVAPNSQVRPLPLLSAAFTVGVLTTVVMVALAATERLTGPFVALGGGVLFTLALLVLARSIQHESELVVELGEHSERATRDLLTALPNRAGLTASIDDLFRTVSRGNLVGVLFVDLDRLKVVNDSLGHAAGDEVLTVVADRLRALVRDNDVLGRFGSDEFVMATNQVRSQQDLEAMAARILSDFRDPVSLADGSLQVVEASIGIAHSAESDSTAEGLLRDADLAMYRAKDAGGSRFATFDSAQREEALARLEVERELRKAIRTGQLIVHYQSVVDARTGWVGKLEALVRWQHPERGTIPPGQFLAVASESGLIVDLGEHVLREACRQGVRWTQQLGRPIAIAVNVAERQLADPGLVGTVRRVLAETSMDPACLELEITEELIVDRLGDRMDVLHELTELGVKLAIDDFGTSRASLGQLKRLKMVDTLKIDRAFVAEIASDRVDQKIVAAVVAIADSVGMDVVAEGVEDEESAVALEGLGVELLQGFHYCRPAAPAELTTQLTRRFDLPWLDDGADLLPTGVERRA